MKKIAFSILSVGFFALAVSVFAERDFFHAGDDRQVAGDTAVRLLAYDIPGSTTFQPTYDLPDSSSGDEPTYELSDSSNDDPTYETSDDASDHEELTYETSDSSDDDPAYETSSASYPSSSTDDVSADRDVTESVLRIETDDDSDENREETDGESVSASVALPSVPDGIDVRILERGIVRIRWGASSGGHVPLRYVVYRDGKRIATVDERNYDDSSVEEGVRYGYSVEAVDGLKNVSGRSRTVTILVPSVSSDGSGTEKPLVLTVGSVPDPDKVYRDSDGDGLSDAEEERLGTDSQVVDSDGDGFPDDEEIRNGFDPLRYSPGDKSDRIVFESPREDGAGTRSEREDARYVVEKVERKTSVRTGGVVTEISGRGLPNANLTLYVFSDPIVVAIQTDADGNWRYELDRNLEDGKHEVYVAVTDNLGRVTAQSRPLPFTKTAEAVTIDEDFREALAGSEGTESPMTRGLAGFIAVGVTVGVAVIAVVILLFRRKSASVS